jgi:hypothetical protein
MQPKRLLTIIYPALPLRRRVIRHKGTLMNNIVWLVGAIVIILAVLGFFGLR